MLFFRYIVVLCFFMCGFNSEAQKILIYNELISLDEANKEALEYIEDGDFEDALFYYYEFKKQGYLTPYIKYRIGECLLRKENEILRAIGYLEESCGHLANYFDTTTYSYKAPLKAWYLLAKAYRLNYEFDLARNQYQALYDTLSKKCLAYDIQRKIKSEILLCDKAKEIIQNRKCITFENMGQRINNSYSNFNPVITDDERSIYFMNSYKFYDAIMHSEVDVNRWEYSRDITAKIGSDGQYNIAAISFDKTKILLTGINPKNHSRDIYQCEFTNGKWGDIIPLNNNINSKFDETHASFSTDGSTLFFTSSRPGGKGGLDIYYSKLEDFGDWGEPVNLGSPINTSGDEDTPFISKDGSLMFFSSNGHAGIGGYDIFYSNKYRNKNWSTPVNLGYPINSTKDDLFFIPVQNGTAGYYSIARPDGYGDDDIFRVELPELVQPMTYHLNLQLEDDSDGFLDSLKVKIVNKQSTDTINILAIETNDNIKNKNTGFDLDNYYISLDKKQHKTKETLFESVKEIKLDEINQVLKEKPIYFDINKYQLNENEVYKIEDVSNYLTKNKKYKLIIVGHTDKTGDAKYNHWLSQQRAQEVCSQFEKLGIDKNRIITNAYGESKTFAQDINPDGTLNPFGAKLNRRVELEIVR